MSEKPERDDKIYAFRTVSMWFVIAMNLIYVGYVSIFTYQTGIDLWRVMASLTLIALLLNMRGIHRKDERFI